MIVAVISDTHLPRGARRIPESCLEQLRTADVILHAGDVTAASVLDELEALGPPLHAVHGNMDDATLRDRLPRTLVVDVGGVRIGMTHDAGPRAGREERLAARFPGCAGVVYGHTHPRAGREERLAARFPGCAGVVYGHTHEPQVAPVGKTWILNPGSPTERRRAPSHTMLVLEVAGGTVRPELVALS